MMFMLRHKKQKKIQIISFADTAKRSVLVFAALAMVIGFPATVYADSLQEQIDALRNQVSGDQQNVASLKGKEDDLQSQIGALQGQISSTQAQINLSQSQLDDLAKQIKAAEDELTRQKKVLGINIKAMYVEGSISTVEMLASSKNISDYLDKQQYRDSVKDKITTTVQQINKLKEELNQSKERVGKLLEDQQKQKAQLASKQNQLNGILVQTNAARGDVEAAIADKQGKIEELRRQQAAINLSRGGTVWYGGSSAYPWDNEGFPCSGGDPWGMCYRQCVSYTAWKVASTGRSMPSWGTTGPANAKDWIWRAEQDGVPVDQTPEAGSVAIDPAGEYGHAMYVESVSGGTIHVSQYNIAWDGRYSEGTRSTSGLYFIHFK